MTIFIDVDWITFGFFFSFQRSPDQKQKKLQWKSGPPLPPEAQLRHPLERDVTPPRKLEPITQKTSNEIAAAATSKHENSSNNNTAARSDTLEVC